MITEIYKMFMDVLITNNNTKCTKFVLNSSDEFLHDIMNSDTNVAKEILKHTDKINLLLSAYLLSYVDLSNIHLCTRRLNIIEIRKRYENDMIYRSDIKRKLLVKLNGKYCK